MRGSRLVATLVSLSALAAPAAAQAASGTGGTAPEPGAHPSGDNTGGARPSGSGGSGGSGKRHPHRSHANTGGARPSGSPQPGRPTDVDDNGGLQPQPAPVARLRNGRAHAPAGAPRAVRRAIRAGNRLRHKPYRYGGGHRSFKDDAYDCSGAVSYALHGGRLLSSPLDSTSFMEWGVAGAGTWISVYANPDHAYVVIAGLRLDTSGTGGNGPRWTTEERDPSDFTVRHPDGL